MTKKAPENIRDLAYTPAEYNEVTKQARLVVITLVESEVRIKAEFHDPEAKRKLAYDTDVASVHYDPETGAVSALCRFAVEGRIGRKLGLKIRADFFVVYECQAGLNSHAAEAFCSHIGMYAAYPYFRAWVSNAAAAGNLRLPPMPSLSSVGKTPPSVPVPNALSAPND